MLITFTGAMASATLLGLSAGLSPGPLLTLVITETLRRDAREGMKVALSPLLTDIPIVAITVLVLSQLTDHMRLIGVISLLGGVFVAYLGYDSLMFKGTDPVVKAAGPSQSLRRGVVANLLNPSPYLFWLSIGAPLILDTWRVSPAAAGAFLFVFYLLLVSSKIFIAVAVGKSRHFLKSGHYVLAIRCLGLTLLIFAGYFFKNAWTQLAGA